MIYKSHEQFKILADKAIHPASEDKKPVDVFEKELKRLVHQVMMNEHGFSYMQDLEFNDCLFKEYHELKQLVAQALDSYRKTI